MPDEFEQFLASYDPEVQEIARAARKLVMRVVPDAQEKVLRPWKTVAYGLRGKFCAISPHARWVNLQLHAGASLEDPLGLLEGTGKSMRHVKLDSVKAARRRGLSALLKEAARAAE